MRDDALLLARVTHRDAPGPGEQGRLNRRGALGVPRGDVVGPAPAQVHRAVPEDGVSDEPVRPTAVQQALELAPGAASVEAPPDDRVEARVPVPLPGVV